MVSAPLNLTPPPIYSRIIYKKFRSQENSGIKHFSCVYNCVSKKQFNFSGPTSFLLVQLERHHTKSQFLFNFIISLFIIDWVRSFVSLTIGKAWSRDCCAEAVQTSFLSTHEHLYYSVQYFCIAYL